MENPSQKQRPVSTQRSMSVMTIDTAIAQNAYTPQLRRNNSVAQPRPRSVYSSEPVMSPDELTAKIADSFQQFSSMLNQMQKTTPKKEQQQQQQQQQLHSPISSRPTTPLTNKLNGNLNKRNSGTVNHRHSLKEDHNNRNMILSPISLVSPSSISGNTTKQINGPQQEVCISPLDNSSQPQPCKLQPVSSNTKKWTKKVDDKQLVNRFLRAASNGDTELVQDLVRKCRDLVYVTDDDEGTTGLIYATCFGHLDTVQALLEAGTPINEPDNLGWTALMWATVNQHDTIVDLLLRNNAIPEIPSVKGSTAFDFVLGADTVVASLLQPSSNFSRRHNLTMDRMVKKKKSMQLLKKSARRQSTPVFTTTNPITAVTGINNNSNNSNNKKPSFQQSGMDTYTHFMTTESDRHRLLTQRHELFYDALLNLSNGTTNQLDDAEISGDDDDNDDQQNLAKYESSIRSSHTFVWDSCIVDQMFVFSMDDLASILDVALDTKSISKMTAATTNKDETLWIPANLLFLCARFAYYYACRGVLGQFFDTVIARLTKVIKQSAKDTLLLNYWMTNIHQLLIYLKRDIGLKRSTERQQQQLADLMVDLYTLFIKNCERRLEKLVDCALLDYEPIQDMTPVDFVDSNDWSNFFQRRGSTRASLDGQASTDGNSDGPQTITTILDGIYDTMTTVYELPDYLAKHTIMQCLYYVLCEGFNQILSNKKYLCRSKAQHTRLNVSVLEEWARQQLGHVNLAHGLDRLTELLQLLQRLSELTNVDALKSTCHGLLNAAQIKRCVINYRYETQEPHLPKHVVDWVTQWAQEQQQQQQQQQQDTTQTLHHNIQQLKDRLYDKQPETLGNQQYMTDVGLLLVDSRWILPFDQQQQQHVSVPPSTNDDQPHSSESMYQAIKQRAQHEKKGSQIRIPSLPYKLIDRLDKKLHK
ncbi:hypothetical protein BC941DRAFT_499874 [Chlamydoabsidia padenii]|nr:hypothetical protein BC941DRAFT_499874 [Chlamydoabsidia padenii]